MRLLAIDPGTTQSAWVEYEDGVPVDFVLQPNDIVLDEIRYSRADELAIEVVASYGMPVGREVFETCVWTGRFMQRWMDHSDSCNPVHRVYRKDVKLHLCGTNRAKDGNVRQALIDRYGGKELAIGRKASPGPLYGIKADIWAALAVAVFVADANTTGAPEGAPAVPPPGGSRDGSPFPH